jgi:hypothetical protein
MPKLEIRCGGTHSLELEELKDFQGDLKKLSKVNREKLRGSLESLGYSAPIFVWNKNIIDGHQRRSVLLEMKEQGWEIPPLPVVNIAAKSKKEAKEKLLHITSQYGKFDRDGLSEFLQELDLSDIQHTINLADGNYRFNPEVKLEDDPEINFTEELKEEHNYIVLYFDNEVDWLQAETLFDLERVADWNSKKGFIRQGVGRVLNGAKALEKLRGKYADLS